MSIFNKCPYNNEECVYENFSLNLGIPKSDTCNTCSVYKSMYNTDDSKENNNIRLVNFGIYCRLNNCKKYKDYGYMTAWTTTEEEAICFCKTLADKDKENKYYYFYVDLNDDEFSIINPTGDKNGRLR